MSLPSSEGVNWMNLRRLGGLSALILAAAYLVGAVLNFTLLDTSSILDPVAKVDFITGKQTLFQVWIFFVYVVFGVCLVFLAEALLEQLRAPERSGSAPALARTATAFALIWAGLLIAAGNVYIAGLTNVSAAFGQYPAQAVSAWLAIDSVHQGLSGTAEIPGGLWTLLISLAMLQAARYPRALCYLGIAIGALGLLTVIPALFMPAVAAYALGHCAWWIWLAVLLLRKGSPETARGSSRLGPVSVPGEGTLTEGIGKRSSR
jgi:hypothetical protein